MPVTYLTPDQLPQEMDACDVPVGSIVLKKEDASSKDTYALMVQLSGGNTRRVLVPIGEHDDYYNNNNGATFVARFDKGKPICNNCWDINEHSVFKVTCLWMPREPE